MLLQIMRNWLNTRLTLRLKLTFWMAGLLSLASIALIILINVTANFTMPHVIASALLGPVPSFPEKQTTQVLSPPSQTANWFVKGITLEIQQEALQQIRLITVLGAILIITLGVGGAYWLANWALYPVNRVIQTVQNISNKNLDRRLHWNGPRDELGKLVGVFNALLDRLTRAFEGQRQFTANVAHELRNPLAVLRTNLEVIQAEPAATLEDYHDMGITLKRNVTRLERLIEDLLLLARGEKETVMESINLGALAQEVLQDLHLLAEKGEVFLDLDCSTDVVVHGDEVLLARALANLVENGIRYNRTGGKVCIRIENTQNWALIHVEDDGVGIPQEEQANIFERFYRVEHTSRLSKGGHGLGLAITSHIIRLHGGFIQVESLPGLGSTFTIHLPL